MTVRPQEVLMSEVKQHHAEEVSVWKDTSRKNADSFISDVEVGRAGSVKISVERNFCLPLMEGHVRGLHILVNPNVEQKITLTEAMEKIQQLLESARSIGRLEYSMKILKLARSEQRILGLVESKDLELQTMPGWWMKLSAYGRRSLS